MSSSFQLLKTAFEQGRLSHAYILVGDPYAGAADLAMKLSQLLVCSGPHPRPCGTCSGCNRATEKTHPDIRWIEPEGAQRTIKVEKIEEIINDYRLTAFEGGWRVSIIRCSENFHEAAANKFLKTLEEPPPKSLFLLLTANPDANLPTIRSRCQTYTLAELSMDWSRLGEWGEKIREVLRHGFPVTDAEVLETTRRFSQIFEEARKEITARATKDLKDSAEDLDKNLLQARISGEARGLWRDLCRLIQAWYRDILIVRSGAKKEHLFFPHEIEFLERVATRPNVTQGRVRRVVIAMDEAARQMANNLPPLTAFESALSRMT